MTSSATALDAAAEIARAAGRYLLQKRAALVAGGGIAPDRKGRNDFVTAADRGAEDLIKSGLQKAFPGDAFLGEESGGAGWDADSVWIVDPLDGTTNFIHGLPLFSVSIGRLKKGRPDLGIIFDPSHDELFAAAAGGAGGAEKSATLNGAPIRCRDAGSLEGAFLATGFPFREISRLEEYGRLFTAVTRASQGLRRCGSAAIDLAWTACGRFNGFFELGLAPWDVAAGWCLVEAAGGIVSDLYETNPPLPAGHILATSADIHVPLQRLLREARDKRD
jgi:myo-inositol-1(or 4)-monophosphatase